MDGSGMWLNLGESTPLAEPARDTRNAKCCVAHIFPTIFNGSGETLLKFLPSL